MPLAIRRVQIAKLKQEGRRRLLVDMADIRRHDEKLEKAVRMAPTEYIGAFEEALTDAIKNEDPTYFKVSEQRCGAIGGRSSPWGVSLPLAPAREKSVRRAAADTERHCPTLPPFPYKRTTI